MIYLFTELRTGAFYMDVASYCDRYNHYFFRDNIIYSTESSRAHEIDITRLGTWREYNPDVNTLRPFYGRECIIYEENKLPEIQKIYDLKSHTTDIEKAVLEEIEKTIYDSIFINK
jgi:hypothetical protein